MEQQQQHEILMERQENERKLIKLTFQSLSLVRVYITKKNVSQLQCVDEWISLYIFYQLWESLRERKKTHSFRPMC